jgi:hypothetical protein
MRPPSYRRLVLGLQSGRIDTSAFRAAAFLASSLKLKMHAILVENQSLLRAARLPMARELVLPTYDWRPADPKRLTEELRNEAEHVHLRIDQEIRKFGIECGFEVRRGDPAGAVTAQCTVQDIITVIASVDPLEHLSGTARRMRQAALASEASVLLLPPYVTQPEGPVVAVALNLEDEALTVASQIADTSGRALLVVMAASRDALAAPTASGERVVLPPGATLLPLAERGVSAIVRALGGRRGSVLVASRAIDLPGPALDLLSTELGMPVLMTEPSTK